MTVEATLAERGKSYGEFRDGAKIAMDMFAIVTAAPSYAAMTADKQYAAFMVCAKLARLLNGDPEHRDSWLDIAGYAQLAHDRCEVVA